VIFESYIDLGYNYRLTDIQAAVGREQLKRLKAIIERRRMMAERYHQLLGDVSGWLLPKEPTWARSNWQSYCVRLPAQCDQRTVMQKMLGAGISTRRGVMCIHREPAYTRDVWSCGGEPCKCDGGTCKRLMQSELAQDHSILLPLFHQMTEADQDFVVEKFREACA